MNEAFPTGMDPSTLSLPSRLHRLLEPVCRWFALAGGLVLVALIIMSLISLVGRKLFATPIRGDMELMEMGAAIAIAAFLPLCELHGRHIKADAFTLWAPDRVNRRLDIFAHLLMFLAAALLTWRTFLQMQDNMEYGDVSTLLSVPMWIPMMLLLPSLALLALAALARILDLLKIGREEAAAAAQQGVQA